MKVEKTCKGCCALEKTLGNCALYHQIRWETSRRKVKLITTFFPLEPCEKPLTPTTFFILRQKLGKDRNEV